MKIAAPPFRETFPVFNKQREYRVLFSAIYAFFTRELNIEVGTRSSLKADLKQPPFIL